MSSEAKRLVLSCTVCTVSVVELGSQTMVFPRAPHTNPFASATIPDVHTVCELLPSSSPTASAQNADAERVPRAHESVSPPKDTGVPIGTGSHVLGSQRAPWVLVQLLGARGLAIEAVVTVAALGPPILKDAAQSFVCDLALVASDHI